MTSTRVHVVSFSPSGDRSGVAGFEWRSDLGEAIAVMRSYLDEEGGAHNLSLVHVEVPAGLTPSGITDHIDGILDMIEPQQT